VEVDVKSCVALSTLLASVLAIVPAGTVWSQTMPADALVKALRQGGYVLVMRHASAPQQPPDKQAADADNLNLERQLDDAGRAGATAMGMALRKLKIPIGDVLASPTYRALQTVRYAQLANPQSHAELGDRGQSMKGVTDADGAWLRERTAQLPKGTNTIIVTHTPNLTRAFPEWGAVADGEVVVVGSDGKGGTRPVGRIKIDEWPRL
jgi:phosphohistidine phosphatase SixA